MQPSVEFSENAIPLDNLEINPDNEERTFMNAIGQGFTDIEEGRTTSPTMAKKRLSLV